MRCATSVSAYLLISHMGSVRLVTANIMMGWSAGLLFLNEGGAGMPGGSKGSASAMAVWTSTAAPSMSRSRSN